ncbi:unnamed protein product, partial [Didymodactylos carnosus]
NKLDGLDRLAELTEEQDVSESANEDAHKASQYGTATQRSKRMLIQRSKEIVEPAQTPKQQKQTQLLSRTGLTYIEDTDRLRCDQCQIEISNLTSDMNPFDEHARQSPTCPLVHKVTSKQQQHEIVESSSPSSTEMDSQKLQKIETSTCIGDTKQKQQTEGEQKQC